MGEVTRTAEESDCEVDDVPSERDGLQVGLHATASQLLNVGSTVTTAWACLDQRSERLEVADSFGDIVLGFLFQE